MPSSGQAHTCLALIIGFANLAHKFNFGASFCSFGNFGFISLVSFGRFGLVGFVWYGRSALVGLIWKV